MKITDHGTWQTYMPNRLPKDAPSGALFTRRVGDSVDWYDYVNSGKNFDDDSVKMTIVNGRVGAAVTDPTRLWPGNNGVVLEVHDVSTDDPQKLFGEKVYDAANETFKDPPPRPMDDLLKRIEALEAREH